METISLNDSNGSISNINNHHRLHSNMGDCIIDREDLIDMANIKMKGDIDSLEYRIERTKKSIDIIRDSLLSSKSVEEQSKIKNQIVSYNHILNDLESKLSLIKGTDITNNNKIERKDSKKKLIEISITTDDQSNNNIDNNKNDCSISNDTYDNKNGTQVSNFQVLDSVSSPSQLISGSFSSSSSSSPPPRTSSNDHLYSNIEVYNINNNTNSNGNNNNNNNSSDNTNNNNNDNSNRNDEDKQDGQFSIVNKQGLEKLLSSSISSSASSSSSSFSSSSTVSSVYQYSYPKSFTPYIPSDNNLEERIDALQIIKLIHFEYSRHSKDKTSILDNLMYNINLNPQPSFKQASSQNLDQKSLNSNLSTPDIVFNNNLLRNQKKLQSLSGDLNKPPKSPEETYLCSPLDEEELSNYYSHSFVAPKVSKSTSNRHHSSQNSHEKNTPKVVVFEKSEPGTFVFKKEKVPKLKDSNVNHLFNSSYSSGLNSITGSTKNNSNRNSCIGFNPYPNNFNTVNGNNDDVDHYYDSFHNTELLDEDVLVYDDLADDTMNDDDTVSGYTQDSSTTNFKISPIVSPNNNNNNTDNPNQLQQPTITVNQQPSIPILQTNHSTHELGVQNLGARGHNRKQHLRSLSHGVIKTPFTDNKLKTLQIFVPTEPYTCKLEITIEENVTVERLISEVIDLCIKEKRKIQYYKKLKLQSENNKSPTSTSNNGLLNSNNSNNSNNINSSNNSNATTNNNNNNVNKNIISPPSSSIVSSSSTSPVTISNNSSHNSGSATSSINSSTNSASSNQTPTPSIKEFESLTFPFLIYTNHRDYMLRKSDENGDVDFCTPPIIRTTEIKKLTNDCFSLVIHPKAIRDLSNHPQIFRVYIEQSQKTSQTSNGKPAEKPNNGVKNSVAVIYKSTSTLQSIKSSICKKEKLELNLCVFMTMNNEVIQNEKITLIELNLPGVKLVYDQHKPQVHKSVSFVSEVGNAPRPITKLLGPIFFFTPDNVCEIKQYVISKINKFGVKKDRYMEINKDKIVYSPIDVMSTLPPPSMVPQNINTMNNTLQPQNTLLQSLQPQTTPQKNNKFFKSFSSKEIKTPFQMIGDITGVGTVINKPSSFYLKCNGKTHEYYSSDSDEIVAKIQFIIRSKKEKLI
ncbi:hypothetical protein DICPUDRAFT_98981 [Dictyostelium purpureum]|uniref:Uncharacterized protein n=1 Tax=Dictyostelium purpureum TaxID=5786 RepID=F0ZVB8_DICPU|nr:uncharacterized protein DICPUDRAFT_98981 [Dictyostelium purpureum]EGC32118.1 hypothetical protein DICPUDRAFT_98981 [Dictyostelium purpureum]|eukprot:XP_003291368.1 hypothetical protein DICPUDRAFT_98981 [Dictyostelium purpureum]